MQFRTLPQYKQQAVIDISYDMIVLAIVDTSGSMLGIPITQVDNYLLELVERLCSAQEISQKHIAFSVICFNEKAECMLKPTPVERVTIPKLEISTKADGLYPLSSFFAMYTCLREWLDENACAGRINLLLFSDGMDTDRVRADVQRARLEGNPYFKQASKRIFLTNPEFDPNDALRRQIEHNLQWDVSDILKAGEAFENITNEVFSI